MVRYLVEHGADIDAQSRGGYTALTLATGQEIIRILRSAQEDQEINPAA